MHCLRAILWEQVHKGDIPRGTAKGAQAVQQLHGGGAGQGGRKKPLSSLWYRKERKNERKLTDAEYKKKGEIAKAMKRDNPRMSDEDVYPIATATAKRVAESDPKTGTGKKPKGSGRRLYTDENPKDTVGIKFATPTDARKTVAKVKKISKPFARKIQILTVGEQRAKVMGKNKVAAIFKKGKDAIRRTNNR